MKIITNRQEIAKVMNFGKYPVLDIDLERPIKASDGEIWGFAGCKFRIPEHSRLSNSDFYNHCELNYFYDSGLNFNNPGCCLHSSFGVSDVVEMLDYSRSPIIDKNQEFVLVIHSKKAAMIILTKTDDYKNCNCMDSLLCSDCKDIKGYVKMISEVE